LKGVYDAKVITSDASAKAVGDGTSAGTKKDWTTKKAISDQAKITYDGKKSTADPNGALVTSSKTIYDGQILEESS
jgi:endonuclease I